MSSCLDPIATKLSRKITEASSRAKHAEWWARTWRKLGDRFAGVAQYEVRCTCGVFYSQAEFDALPEPRGGGIMEVPRGDCWLTEPAYRLSLRNCGCGSTISRVLDVYDVRTRAYVLPPDGWEPKI